MNISNLLVAIDGDYDVGSVVAEVSRIAVGAGVRVTLLSVLNEELPGLEKNIAISNLRTWEESARSRDLEAISFGLAKAGVEVTIRHATGSPYLEVIRETLRRKYDLVMKPAHSDTLFKRVLLGSTDLQIFRLCPVPVWIFRPKKKPKLKKLMIAIDLDPHNAERTALARKAMQLGEYVAGLAGAEIHVLHVWSLYRDAILRGSTVSKSAIKALSKAEEQLHHRWLDEAIASGFQNESVVRAHLINGETSDVILDTVESLKIDLLVMGTVGRTGIPGFFIGNTADALLRQATCSVLAIKPDGFSTPVTLNLSERSSR